ncbi:uncharacterized protein LOC127851111 [Dreissena polymorpha]|uniref:LITAF domain-containing protein n=1 Tax=Dreissena polymorpha TaxID=45954 RepID=A0A9D4D1F6_DREPO|nr:uncharacterized protein LOC127851111 [Dreissena polymorpha]XP_052240616.1 uncharacterized protein LOC127851111 [Dreissena polymorpha]XP_052240618.1 uncharacterized protein LOC127851111 [Dreissena polymorpha]XP_052240619.1 uncharacterized protein LOC127851111 [Dreissena polymorpha]XP_052240620.1 uncharacterized protein LOC127851111 [Dreissena polymorpha]XP_052240621.1 uncharacterized protein LOC127851111 [Dreissena polymorpha]XP_052240622.1 uncharacterized protein LOC127851111 [Dreissena po
MANNENLLNDLDSCDDDNLGDPTTQTSSTAQDLQINDLDSSDEGEEIHVYQTTSTVFGLPLYSSCDQPNPKASAAPSTRCAPTSATFTGQANTDRPAHQTPSTSLPTPLVIPHPPLGILTYIQDLQEENAQIPENATCIMCNERIRRAVCLNTLQNDGKPCGGLFFCESPVCYNVTVYCPRCKRRMGKVCIIK